MIHCSKVRKLDQLERETERAREQLGNAEEELTLVRGRSSLADCEIKRCPDAHPFPAATVCRRLHEIEKTLLHEIAKTNSKLGIQQVPACLFRPNDCMRNICRRNRIPL